jgi:gamma-glutamylputrescine oxidase
MRLWGEPPWNAIAPGQSRAAAAHLDLAIVGGGFTGMSAALHAARRGMRVVVFEAGLVGDGASGRTGGIVLEGTAVGVLPGANDCVPALDHLVRELQIDCDLRLPGCWEIEHQRPHPRDDSALPWSDGGAPIRIARIVAGGTVEPRALLRGLAEAAIGAGAAVCERSPVRRVRLERGPALELDDRVVRPKYIIVALNAWTAALIPNLPRIHSALTFACATEPLADAMLAEIGLGARIPFYTADTPYLWGRVTTDNRVVFGAALAYGAPPELERYDVTANPGAQVLARLEQRVHRLHPALGKITIPWRWAGPIAFTDDAIPLLARHRDCPQLFVAGAYAGHGVAFSVYAGALMARALCDNVALPAWGGLSR